MIFRFRCIRNGQILFIGRQTNLLHCINEEVLPVIGIDNTGSGQQLSLFPVLQLLRARMDHQSESRVDVAIFIQAAVRETDDDLSAGVLFRHLDIRANN